MAHELVPNSKMDYPMDSWEMLGKSSNIGTFPNHPSGSMRITTDEGKKKYLIEVGFEHHDATKIKKIAIPCIIDSIDGLQFLTTNGI